MTKTDNQYNHLIRVFPAHLDYIYVPRSASHKPQLFLKKCMLP